MRISVNVGLGMQEKVQFASRYVLNYLTVGILIGRFFHKGTNGMLFACKITVGGTNMRHHVALDVVLMAGSMVNS